MTARRFARQWATALTAVHPSAAVAEQLADTLAPLVDRLLTALAAPGWDPAVAEQLGDAIAELGFHSSDTVDASLPVLSAVCRHADVTPEVTSSVAARFGFGAGRRGAATTAQVGDGFEIAFRHAAVAVSIGDAQGRIIDANPAFERLTGLSLEQLRGLDGFELAGDEADAERQRLFDQLAATDSGTVRYEQEFPRPDGELSWVSWTVTQCLSANGERTYLLGFGQDLTEQHAATERLQWQAHHDPLTGLANRRHLHSALHALITGAEPGHRVAVFALDVDDFKSINDTFGHTAGDRILVELGTRLQQRLDGEDTLLARIGGDEFIVVLPPAAAGRTRDTVEILRAAVTEPFDVADTPISVTISIGALVAPLPGTSVPELLAGADECLYQAKAAGKNSWVLRPDA
ncbi:diguanylate cyclase domain-containing protein [Nocardia sp. NPDC059177]|uniref:diguanylate cyclase domain-containing protein n=1 Tax=Nocardia sp. NPDC059177 TaxID=3346759 RepID=UPI0036A10027